MGTKRFLHQRHMAAAALLGAALTVGSFAPRPAEAMVGGCVSDPFVILSNETVMHLYAVLPETSIGDVQSFSYSLVLPAGTSVVQEVATDGIVGTKEHFQYEATNPPGLYVTTTLAQTQTQGDPVMATTSLVTAGSSNEIATRTIRGQTNRPLKIHLDVYGDSQE